MTNLFSSFDPSSNIIGLNLGFNWVSLMVPLAIFPVGFWLVGSQLSKTLVSVRSYVGSELRAVFGPVILPGTLPLFLTFFFFILLVNFIGLVPRVFTGTSHLSITLSFRLPLWLGYTIWSLFFQFNDVICHLVPIGTPTPLMPIIVLIERVRNVIRPGTLAVRLAANIVAGHLLLTLLGSLAPRLGGIVLGFLFIGLILLLILEVGVACVQAYVFTVLRSLFLRESCRPRFDLEGK